MDIIKSNLKAVVGSAPNGVALDDLQHQYQYMTKSLINFRQFNYNSLRCFLETMKDVVTVRQHGIKTMVFLVEKSSDPPSLQQLRHFICHGQVQHQKRYTKGSCFRYVGRASGGQNVPKRSCSALETSATPRLDGNKQPCAVSNRLGPGNVPPAAQSAHPNPNNNNSNSNHGVNNAVNANNRNQHNASRHLSKPKPSAIRNGVKAPVNCSNGGNKSCNEVASSQSVHRSSMNNESIIIDTADKNVVSNDTSSEEARFVPRSHEINVNVVNRPVKVLGIQSGYALTQLADFCVENSYLETDPVDSVFPGDFLLWQPACPDPNRPVSSVDTASVFPVTALSQLGSKLVKVRIVGLKVLLPVPLDRLFKIPANIDSVVALRSRTAGRPLTLLRLGGVPSFLDIWDPAISVDTYVPLLCKDGDKEHILENRGHPGDFLNVSLISYFYQYCTESCSASDLDLFHDNLSIAMDFCKQSLEPSYRRLWLDSSLATAESELLPLKSVTNIQDRMFLGCPKLFADAKFFTGKAETIEDSLKLERIVYDVAKKRFVYYDDDNMKEVVWASKYGSDTNKYPGLYCINEAFISSNQPQLYEQRFQASMLVQLLSMSELRESGR